MNDPMISARDRFYAEEERKMARRDEVERQEGKAERSMVIHYTSMFVNGKEMHSAEILDESENALWWSKEMDSLEDVIIIARSKRDKIASEMAEKAVKDAEKNQ